MMCLWEPVTVSPAGHPCFSPEVTRGPSCSPEVEASPALLIRHRPLGLPGELLCSPSLADEGLLGLGGAAQIMKKAPFPDVLWEVSGGKGGHFTKCS